MLAADISEAMAVAIFSTNFSRTEASEDMVAVISEAITLAIFSAILSGRVVVLSREL